MDPASVKMAIRYSMTLAPFVLPTIMFVATQRAASRAKRIKYLALNEEIPFAEFAAAELRVRWYAFATFVFALIGAIGLAVMLMPSSGETRKNKGPGGEDEDVPSPSMTSRDLVPDYPKPLKPSDLVDNP